MQKKTGATLKTNNKCEFVVWAPFAQNLQVELPEYNIRKAMQKDEWGYWQLITEDATEGDLYFYIIDEDKKRPDPASMAQPHDIHGPSQIINSGNFEWEDQDWKGISPGAMIIYELHTGTFSEKGTFEGITEKLDYLAELGINTIELMPVGQFPGGRNWGYDGVYPFAVQWQYGGAYEMQKFVNACHKQGFAVILDVIYNHLGPEGNYLWDYGPYFTHKYATPWGEAINFDDAWSDQVRAFFIQNAIMWFKEFHIDALRLDAVHAIVDRSAYHFLAELEYNVTQLENETNKKHYLIAECDLNDVRYINPKEKGGYQLDAQWVDEFHHALHALVTGERNGYYEDFGSIEKLAKAYKDAYVYDGIYSDHRKKTFGSKAKDNPGHQFIVFSQNHDQIGNRMMGDRLSTLVSYEMLKVIAGAVFTAPYVPMIFMGEEYGESNPFLYFISHTDQELVELVREGRKAEFKDFHHKGEAPDPGDINTFSLSKLQYLHENYEKNNQLLSFYKKIIGLRKENPALSNLDRNNLEVKAYEKDHFLSLKRWDNNQTLLIFMNFGKTTYHKELVSPSHNYKILINSADEKWGGAVKGAEDPDSKNDTTLSIQSESIIILSYKK